MKAVVFHEPGDIRLEEVDLPAIEQATDAIIRITSSAICGTDLHFVRGTYSGMEAGTILGHEAVGVIEECGRSIRNLKPGDRVVVASTIACGNCVYCRSGYYAQCDVANPNGLRSGTAFFGGPKTTGSFQGLQAEYARIPFANVGLVRLPDEISDDQAILLSDIFPTGYFGAKLAEISEGDTVAVFGCGPVGLFAITSAFLEGAGRVFGIDHQNDRLSIARDLGAEIINFDQEDPVEVLLELTAGIGPDRVIDAVGVDAEYPARDAPKSSSPQRSSFQAELDQISDSGLAGHPWHPGDAPSLALQWAVSSVAKAGTIGVIGVYPPQLNTFPIGMAMGK
ncbi:MAG TPA: alcohol dehydrogenase catalytic domain-containing protein, partial [Planctomicrobium sp.]|nr:alcohol dehydrogenase catalytic domain-containing protein [Planctomicrobium sp.]